MMKCLRDWMVLVLCGLAALCGTAAEPEREVRNYVLYYGPVDGEDAFRQLGEYDMIIIDPQALGAKAKEQIAGWKRLGRTVIGYLSCMEVASWHRYRDRADLTKILKLDGKPFQPFGDNLAMDLADPTWQDLVVELMQSEVIDYGCDGVFMDTLADVEHPDLPESLRQEQLRGMDELLAKIRKAYPELIMISNWTVEKTLPVAAKYVDMVCWENCNPAFFAADHPAVTFMRQVRDDFKREQARRPFRVLALWAIPADTEKPEAQRRAMTEKARELGYLNYSCYRDYHHGFLPLEQ